MDPTSIMTKALIKISLIAINLLSGILAQNSSAQTPDLLQPTAKEQLQQQGLIYSLDYLLDYAKDTYGGIRNDDSSMYTIALDMLVDAEKLWGLPYTSVYSSIIHTSGEPASNYVGDLQGVSSLQAPAKTRLYQLWFQQTARNGWYRLGMLDINQTIDVIPSAHTLLNSAFRIGSELRLSTGESTGPAIYPVTALGGQIKLQDHDEYWQLALVDARAGSTDDPQKPAIRVGVHDGIFVITEYGIQRDVSSYSSGKPVGKTAYGFWAYSRDFDDLVETDDQGPKKRINFGGYILGESLVFTEPGDPHQGLTVFSRLGWANHDVNAIGRTFTAGLVYQGMFRHREQDRTSLAMSIAQASGKYRRATNSAAQEVTFEISHQLMLHPKISIQPDFQWVHTPGLVNTRKTARVFILRLSIDL